MDIGKDFIGIGAGVLIINNEYQTLLLKRSAKSRNAIGAWAQPGGRVEFGETVETAVRRETREELGIEVGNLHLLGYTDHLLPAEGQHWVAFNFVGTIASGTPANLEPEKAETIAWFDLDHLPESLAEPTRETIQKFLARFGKNFFSSIEETSTTTP